MYWGKANSSTLDQHPFHFQKTFAVPIGHKSPQLQGAWSAHEQTCKTSREAVPHPLKQQQGELKVKVICLFGGSSLFFWTVAMLGTIWVANEYMIPYYLF